jgi:hypothetical protein
VEKGLASVLGTVTGRSGGSNGVLESVSNVVIFAPYELAGFWSA